MVSLTSSLIMVSHKYVRGATDPEKIRLCYHYYFTFGNAVKRTYCDCPGAAFLLRMLM